MFLLVTPLNFLLILFYFSFFLIMLNELDLFVFWFFIELASLFFVGFSLCTFVSGFTGLLQYFLIQSISSLILLVGLGLSSVWLCTFSFILNLGLFPFMFWYLPVVYSFTSFSLFLVLTFQNVPLILLFSGFSACSLLFDSYSILLSSLLAGFLGGVAMLSCLDFRVLLVLGSFSGTSWFLFSSFNLNLFLFFFVFYSLSLFTVLNESGLFSNLLISSNFYSFILLLSLSGLPPFPVFFSKFFVVFIAFSFSFQSFLLFLLLLVSILTVVGYFSWVFNYLVYSYSSNHELFC